MLAELDRQLKARIAVYEADRLTHFAGLPNHWTGRLPDWIRRDLGSLRSMARQVDGGPIPPVPGPSRTSRDFPGLWREARSWVYLHPDSPAPTQPFLFSGLSSLAVTVLFRSIASQPATITATCSGAVQLRTAERTSDHPVATPFTFEVAARQRDEVGLILPRSTRSCTLDIRFRGRTGTRRLQLIREEGVNPGIDALDRRLDVCTVPDPRRMDRLEAAFYAGRWLSQTCPMDPGEMRLLPASRDGFNAKVEALIGRTLPDSVFDNGDPTIPLDFSRAPRLDLVYLSYLDLKADFSGYLIERMLRFHAARGTLIRIIVSDVLELEKDRALYEGLAADFPNVQLQLFEWSPVPLAPIEEYFDSLHRVHHIKLFATLSPDPGRSRAILGGRNIHDGFLFNHSLDLSAFPALQNYGEPGELSIAYFSTYHDFEVELLGDSQVRTLAAHLSTFWHRDHVTNVYRPFSIPVADPARPDPPRVAARHFMSVPYMDGGALEQYWVDLIDSAATSVEIVTPYLNPTPRIEAALNRAHDRGVRVMIVARIRLHGDLGGRLMTEMNMLFVERYADRFILCEYDPEDVVLHTKMLLIDGRLSIVTSTNLNRRSFIHDTENGLAVLDPAFYRRMRAVVEGYLAVAHRLRPTDTDISDFSRRLFRSEAVRDLF